MPKTGRPVGTNKYPWDAWCAEIQDRGQLRLFRTRDFPASTLPVSFVKLLHANLYRRGCPLIKTVIAVDGRSVTARLRKGVVK